MKWCQNIITVNTYKEVIIPNASTHLNFAVLVMTLLFFKLEFSNYNELAIYVISVLLGSILPDIDHHKSTLSKIIPFYLLHKVLKNWTTIFKHGGITHTILVNMLIFAWYWWTGNILVLGLSIGYASHLYNHYIDGNKLNMLWYPLGRRK